MNLFWSPSYNAVQKRLETFRKSKWIAASLHQDPIVGVEVVAPVPVSPEEMLETHDPEYLNAVGSDALLWESVAASTGGMLAAAHMALIGGVAGTLSSGLHHARKDKENGYCTLNGLAHTALTFLDRGFAKRILILDLDAHCGGGTDSFIHADPRIVQIDISTNEFDAYAPSDWNTLKLVQDTGYLTHIQFALDRIEPDFDLVLYNAGVDPVHSGVSQYTLCMRDRIVFQFCKKNSLPVAFTIAGGYLWPCPHLKRALTRKELVDLHRNTILEAVKIQG